MAGLKPLLRSLLYRLKYPGASLGQGCFIRKDSRIARGVEVADGGMIFGGQLLEGTQLGKQNLIEAGAKLCTSKLGNRTTVQAQCVVSNSVFEGNSTVQPSCLVDQVTLGAWSYVARETILNGVDVGRFCSIGPRCLIGAGDHPSHLLTTSPVFYSDRGQCGPTFAPKTTFVERRAIHIGHDVWIGAQVFICDGVTIGNGSIIAAGAVVNRDVAPYSVVGGVPAKLIRPRFSPAVVERLERLAWWHWDEARLAAAQPFLAQDDPEKFLSWAEAPATK
jgi:acetyltransferase-like isoleucine patch superfamily enzyme